MALAEQPLIAKSHHHYYASTDQKQDIEGSLANSTPTEGPYSDTAVCFCKTIEIVKCI